MARRIRLPLVAAVRNRGARGKIQAGNSRHRAAPDKGRPAPCTPVADGGDHGQTGTTGAQAVRRLPVIVLAALHNRSGSGV